MADRVELKYVVTHEVRTGLLAAWAPYLEPAPFTDTYGVYPIRSLYFDSPYLRFYDEKIDGEALRNKVRLRAYGYHWPEARSCFLEVKRKIVDRIFKFRYNLGPFRHSLFSPSGWDLEAHAEREPAGLLQEMHHLRPAVETFYLREAWESPFRHRLRITFDSMLVALFPGQEFERHMLEEPQYLCLRDTDFILEIKATDGFPIWIAKAIETFELRRQSLSKYCTCIEKLRLHNSVTGVYA